MVQLERKIVLFLALLILGLVMAMQGKGIFSFHSQQTTTASRIENYKKQLIEEQEKAEKLKGIISENEKKKDALIKELAETEQNQEIHRLAENLAYTKLLAGLTDVQGKGVIVTLNDSLQRDVEFSNDLIIHQSDVYSVVNELKAAGAQAISINGERLLATSEQVCAGPTIRINNNRYSVPYIISAIGDPDNLKDTLESSGIVIGMKDDSIRVDIKKSDSITIPKYHDKLDNLITGLEVLDQ